jgi:diguanylate cyclase (GGDEF)-like protein
VAAFFARATYWSALNLCLVLAIPLVLFVNCALFSRSRRWPYEAILLAGSIVAGSVEVVAQVTVQSGNEIVAHAAVLTVLVIVNTVMRLRPSFALLALSWGIAAECIVIFCSPRHSLEARLLEASFVCTIGFLTLIANYVQHSEARLGFLKYVLKGEIIGNLSQINQGLAIAALTDSLTGLANRSSLDSHLSRIWAEPTLATDECSIIMADIDHFKSINDRYGHLYGDRVIKRVAHLIAEALRGQDDVIARYGGDEFVVILPRTSRALALMVAERVRGLVDLAGLPSLRSSDPNLEGLRATISCGVASSYPALSADPYILLGEADEALYRAKREGRNLVLEKGDRGAGPRISETIID